MSDYEIVDSSAITAEPRIIDELLLYLSVQKPETDEALLQGLKEIGCSNPILVSKELNVLIDGHRRYRLCKANNIPFKVKYISCPTINSMKLQMLKEQGQRRNASPIEMAKIISEMARLKNEDGERALSNEQIAEQLNVSTRTVQRALQASEAMNSIDPDAKLAMQESGIEPTINDYKSLSELPKEEQVDAVKSVVAGEHKTISKAANYKKKKESNKKSNGDTVSPNNSPKDRSNNEKPPAKPKKSLVSDAIDALGTLRVSVAILNRTHTNDTYVRKINNQLLPVSQILDQWKKDIVDVEEEAPF